MSEAQQDLPEVRAYGPDAYWVKFADRPDERAFLRSARIMASWPVHLGPDLMEWVPAFTTVVLVFRSGLRPPVERVRSLPFPSPESEGSAAEGRVVELPVCYDGPDLQRVSEHSGMVAEEVVARHQAPLYRVHCLGFAPGFPYLGGLDDRLATPRQSSPRLRVPAGSVAIGGKHTGIYSIPSPGGWNLIGRTPEILFRPWASDTAGMFRLQAGDQVRFIPAAPFDPQRTSAPEDTARGQGGLPILKVISPGTGLGVQDGGRPGYARFGVPPGGAMDPAAAVWANRLVDNPPETPVLELCFQGQKLEVLRERWIALAGVAHEKAGRLRPWTATRVQEGETLEFGATKDGVWSYLAVPGGFESSRCLGSASVNPRAGIGRSLAAGDTLYADIPLSLLPSFTAGRRLLWTEIPRFGGTAPLRVWPGPQAECFSEEQKALFYRSAWRISSQSDRVGYRLEGPRLTPPAGDMESEPVLPGSIQVPPGGQPIVTQRDGPTLGGYPKIGLIEPADLAQVAQSPPGREIRFVPVE